MVRHRVDKHGSRGGAGVVAFLALIAPSSAADELQPVDRYGIHTVAYATVTRGDDTYRRMLVSPDALAAMAEGGPAPEGTRILMETYYRPDVVSTVFHMQKVEGRWLFGSFSADSPDLSVRQQASCLSCHIDAAATDLVFTGPSLRSAARSGAEASFHCDRPGRTPCPPVTYGSGGP